MDITSAADAFIDHFINPHYLIAHEPELLLLSKNDVPHSTRQDVRYEDDDDEDDDFHPLPFSEAGLSETDSVSLLSDAITTPLLHSYAAASWAATGSALAGEIIPDQISCRTAKNANVEDGSRPLSMSALDFIYHILFHDLDELLSEARHPLAPATQQHQPSKRTGSVTSSSANHNNSSTNSKRRRDQPPHPSPAPFDMNAILRAQQEFIHKRQIEEAQAEQSGQKILSSVPKRCRKKITGHPDGGPPQV
ncbi:hypothetical protein BX666DRAFT_768515 [Dichotomocladium elegans]|nr:hypothetical protein BX666DRAFT_768515 [Dichotomocladium elegans]